MEALRIANILKKARNSAASSKQSHSKPKASQTSSYKSTKLSTIQRQSTHTKSIDNNPFKTIHYDQKPPIVQSKVQKGSAVTRGLDDRFLHLRKENHLNTYFNIRKNKLKETTIANKQLYKRLNSQKSLYSSTDMNKSYQSTK